VRPDRGREVPCQRPAKAPSLLDAGEMSPARLVRTRRRSYDVSAGRDPAQNRDAYEIGQEVPQLLVVVYSGANRAPSRAPRNPVQAAVRGGAVWNQGRRAGVADAPGR
jgi:hypothetical protein